MKYRVHIEADFLITLKEGEVQDVEAYLEQFADLWIGKRRKTHEHHD